MQERCNHDAPPPRAEPLRTRTPLPRHAQKPPRQSESSSRGAQRMSCPIRESLAPPSGTGGSYPPILPPCLKAPPEELKAAREAHPNRDRLSESASRASRRQTRPIPNTQASAPDTGQRTSTGVASTAWIVASTSAVVGPCHPLLAAPHHGDPSAGRGNRA